MNSNKARKHLGILKEIALLSKDPSTQVGALVLGPRNEPRSWGYNGAPRGCRADEDERGQTRPEKYFWFSHAETNAITNAASVGIPLEGSVMIVTHPPCMDCARAIVQAGIKQVFCQTPSLDFLDRWEEQVQRSKELFHETGVEYIWL